MNSGELFRRPGGVFSSGKRGEGCGRGWWLYMVGEGNRLRNPRDQFWKGIEEKFRPEISDGGGRR